MESMNEQTNRMLENMESIRDRVKSNETEHVKVHVAAHELKQ